jgi:hypothetical protein
MNNLEEIYGSDDKTNLNWHLPKKYSDMTPKEQAKILRASALRFLRQNGPATVTQIQKAIGAPTAISLKKALDYLAFTSMIYKESWGGRDEIYYPNGKLAHPLFQGTVKCGSYKEYALRTYFDRLTGKNLTITEYTVTPSGRRDAKGGIRIDLVDLDKLINELTRIKNELSKSEVFDRGIISKRGTKNGKIGI